MKNNFLYILVRWSALFAVLVIVGVTFMLKIRNIVFIAAKSEAENIILNAADKAIINVLKDNNITYNSVSVLSRDENGNVTSIEIDSAKINLLKSLISEEMYKIISDNSEYTLSIPIGTLLNYEYTSGYGPKLKFKMKLAHSETPSFKSRFSDAGINNVLHQIIIKTDIKCSVLAAGSSKSFLLSSEAIAAQTVIAGKVPESFTNVTESDIDDTADDIFNFRN